MPAFYRFFPRIAGQPIYFHTLEQGLNPLSKVQTEDGKTTRLGLTPYRLSKSSSKVVEKLQWQDEYIEKWKRLRGVAYQLANMALRVHLGLTEQDSINPHDIITWGPSIHTQEILKSLENNKDQIKQQWITFSFDGRNV